VLAASLDFNLFVSSVTAVDTRPAQLGCNDAILMPFTVNPA